MASNLVSNAVKSDEKCNGILRACRCGRSWCPKCWPTKARKYARDFETWSWERVRFIEFTLDRSMFPGGPVQAYEVGSKRVRRAWAELKRKFHIKVRRQRWFLEWRRDGFAHWHLYVEMKEKGSAGRIGGKALLDAWGLGRVHEDYPRSELHWKNRVGYFGKLGYFDKSKGHQGLLPAWAEFYEKRIKRVSGFGLRGVSVSKERGCKRVLYGEAREKAWHEAKLRQYYAEKDKQAGMAQDSAKVAFARIAQCGAECNIDRYDREADEFYRHHLRMPYWEARKAFKGHYVVGVGYLLNEPAEIIQDICRDWSNLSFGGSSPDCESCGDGLPDDYLPF